MTHLLEIQTKQTVTKSSVFNSEVDALALLQLLCTNPTLKFWLLVMEYAFWLLNVVIRRPNYFMIFGLCQIEHSLKCCYKDKMRTIWLKVCRNLQEQLKIGNCLKKKAIKVSGI